MAIAKLFALNANAIMGNNGNSNFINTAVKKVIKKFNSEFGWKLLAACNFMNNRLRKRGIPENFVKSFRIASPTSTADNRLIQKCFLLKKLYQRILW